MSEALVLASLKGDAALGALLLGELIDDDDEEDEQANLVARDVFIRSIGVTGFRGIGPTATLEVEPAPGLTLIVGRNGSGKSSFSDGLEMLLTGESWRWLNKSKVWTSGWRNLHHPTGASVAAEFVAAGVSSPVAASITWGDDADLSEGERYSQPKGEQRQEMSDLGWDEPLESARPFLSYSELGGLLDVGPTSLYDSLSRALGLDPLVEATERLRQHRLNRNKAFKAVAGSLQKTVLPNLVLSNDPRARSCESYLNTKDWDLDAVRSLVAADSSIDEPDDTERLRKLAALTIPVRDDVLELVARLRSLEERRAEKSKTESGRSAQSSELLAAALKHHEEHEGEDCPVCGTSGVLDSAWAEATQAQLQVLKAAATDYLAIEQEIRQAMQGVRSLPSAPDLSGVSILESDPERDARTEAAAEWNLAVRSTNPIQAANDLEAAIGGAVETLTAIQKATTDEIDRREDAWRPVANEVRVWLDQAHAALIGESQIKPIKTAEDWLHKATDEVRAERFAPIAQQSQEIWSKLSLQSNVNVSDVLLTGKANMRRVEIQVDVDGVEGVALGVMSQGELHSLVLSLYLPRACLDESPFRFVVIDDPVQAMDPARVDGLAEVLSQIAGERQVIVFTHDDRLPEAVRRLQIPARILEVHRRPGSVVELRKSLDPVQQALADGRAIARSENVPGAVKGRVVAGFCRSALEVASIESVRRRWLSSGKTHAEVEKAVLGANRLTHYVSLALFDDIDKGGEVLRTINQRFGRPAGDAFMTTNRGVHGDYHGNLVNLVNDCASLAERIRIL